MRTPTRVPRAPRRVVRRPDYSRAEVLAAWGHLCMYSCGRPATEIEHVRALSAGGVDARRNVAAACPDCNRSRGSRTYAEWASTF